jgi:hypothetical protein
MIMKSPTTIKTLLVLCFATALAACSSKSKEVSVASQEASGATDSAAVARSKQIPRRFDGEGRLLPSDEWVSGIRLPRGSELFREEGLEHVYRIRAPIDKVLAYIGPMMVTGNVERRGKGAVYKRASVRGAEVNPTKVDVSILEVGSSMTRISVTELPPPPPDMPSSAQTKAAAIESFRQLD